MWPGAQVRTPRRRSEPHPSGYPRSNNDQAPAPRPRARPTSDRQVPAPRLSDPAAAEAVPAIPCSPRRASPRYARPAAPKSREPARTPTASCFRPRSQVGRGVASGPGTNGPRPENLASGLSGPSGLSVSVRSIRTVFDELARRFRGDDPVNPEPARPARRVAPGVEIPMTLGRLEARSGRRPGSTARHAMRRDSRSAAACPMSRASRTAPRWVGSHRTRRRRPLVGPMPPRAWLSAPSSALSGSPRCTDAERAGRGCKGEPFLGGQPAGTAELGPELASTMLLTRR